MRISAYTRVFGLSAAIGVLGYLFVDQSGVWIQVSDDFNRGVVLAMIFVAVASLGIDWTESL